MLVVTLILWIGAVQFTAQPVNDIHFHHFHLNVVDPAKSIEFYRQTFGGVPIKFGGRSDAVFTERSFILFSKVETPASPDLDTGVWHLGWGGVDGPSEFVNLRAKGVQFQTPLTPLGNGFYMYLYGPDKEVLEIWTGPQNHLYNHLHFVSKDQEATRQWYADVLGVPWPTRSNPPPPSTQTTPPNPLMSPGITGPRVDNVGFVFFRQPETEPMSPLWGSNKPIKTIQPTKGRVVDHLAFSFRRIDPIFEKLKSANIPIVEPITTHPDYGFRSFFIMGPDNVLLEIVEAKPIPDASWEVE